MTILGNDNPSDPPGDPSRPARRLIRGRGRAALATSLDRDDDHADLGRHPYASLVATACDTAGNPLLLLSDLAQHSANIKTDSRVSLLFEDTGAHADPLAGPRLSLLGDARRVDDPVDDNAARARFVARHPTAARYAGFADFRLYRVAASRGHLVAGFGRIEWIDGAALRVAGDVAALAEAESVIVEHMNRDHAAAVALYAARLLHKDSEGWRMTGIDPEGIDLCNGAETARLEFPETVAGPMAARAALIALVAAARAI
jgi:putative heme iron utilization protein